MIHNICKYAFAVANQANHTKICVIGGGSAGVNFTSHLRKVFKDEDIRVFEPHQDHYYQPGWTMVGGGLCSADKTVRRTKDMFHSNIRVVPSAVEKVDPKNNKFITNDGKEWTYDQLVVATGINVDWAQIKGAREALDDPECPVGSIYDIKYAEKWSRIVDQAQEGTFIFTEPQMPIKCAGAPQKVMYLTDSRLRDRKIRSKFDIQFRKTVGVVFGVSTYAAPLERIIKQKQIDLHLHNKLVEIKSKERIAVFENQQTKKLEEVKFDYLHIVPPQTAPKFIKESGLGDATGFVDVDKETMIHNKFDNVWSLGDSSSLPTSKTFAAITSQAPLLVNNMKHAVKQNLGKENLPSRYDGYTCCPIFVGGTDLIMAEFKYDGVPDTTFLADQTAANSIFYLMKRYVFIWVYWNWVPKGMWFGKKHILPLFYKVY